MKEGDRFIRKVMGHPVTKILAGPLQMEKVVEHFDTPILRILGGYVADFHYLYTEPPHYRRFIILRIRNDGRKAATGCWAHISIEETHLNEIPLHWSDCDYRVRRNSTETITIPPGITRELDVAFSVYGHYLPGEYETVVSTDTNFIHMSQISTRGTMDPHLISTGIRSIDFEANITREHDSFQNELEPMKVGAWIASHLVLANPIENSEHHLSGGEPPRRYNSTIRVTCNEGQSDDTSIVLIVTPSPRGLNFDWRITPRL